ncbi:LysR family transcriptional regulator [Caminibacter profundus]
MTLKELEIFLELSTTQNVLQTAKKLSITQSAVSQAIKSLENKLGEPLFDRIGKKLILNERGRKFKEMTVMPFNQLINAKYQFLKEKVSGTINISTSKTLGTYILPQIIFDYLSKNKNVSIKKEIQNSKKIIENIKNGKIDLGFIENEIDDKDIIKIKIKEDELIVVSSQKHKDVFIDELKNKRWILREEGSGTREIFLSHIRGIFDLEIFMEYNEFEEAKTILINNPDAITCVSKEVVKKELSEKKLFEIKIKNLTFKRNMYLIYHKNKIKTELFEDFTSFILNNLKN